MANQMQRPLPSALIATEQTPAQELECLFCSEAQAARLLGIHRTTLRALALAGHSPVQPIPITEHRRIYPRAEIFRLAGLEP